MAVGHENLQRTQGIITNQGSIVGALFWTTGRRKAGIEGRRADWTHGSRDSVGQLTRGESIGCGQGPVGALVLKFNRF